ncbi:MAG: ABC transporter substrate-binding protein [Deltaproteobacteria bacterium]|jgi:putative ABC transport system substrate-binding protein|nr:ABC transporter substrate-binding protein [Deltaproteobacteria bacterium]
MKNLVSALLFSLLFASTAFAYDISINQFVEHPSLDESIRGFKDQLAAEGLEVTYKMHNAQANMPTVLQIVNQIIGENPSLVLAVATPSAQATVQKIKNIPVLFTAITDPVNAGLVASMQQPGGNVSGTTDMSPIEAQVELIREIHPKAKTLGVIYNAGEANSVVQVDILKTAAAKYNFEVVEAVTVNTAGVFQAAKSLVGKIDAVYLPTDNTVISTLDAIIKVCTENKIPVYAGEPDSVRSGCVATLGISFYDLGKQTGAMAARILRDKANPATMPVEAQTKFDLVINLNAAKQMNVVIPQAILDRAQEKIQ